MREEKRTIVYDEELQLEAYHLGGVVQPFPNHFHDFYVIGLMEQGKRWLCCKNKEYTLERGNLILFHPGDSHACAPADSRPLDYRAFNITKERMLDLTEEITGKRKLPGFSCNVSQDEDAASFFRPLHELVMSGSGEFEKEEHLLLLLSRLIQKYGQPFEEAVPECPEEIETVCAFMDTHFAERICLEQLCRCAGLSKSTLLRAFTRAKGVTPYRYLETVRIGQAKKLLEQGVAPVEAAMQTGFSDQSHFTNYFSSFIGLSPGTYREIFTGKGKPDGGPHES